MWGPQVPWKTPGHTAGPAAIAPRRSGKVEVTPSAKSGIGLPASSRANRVSQMCRLMLREACAAAPLRDGGGGEASRGPPAEMSAGFIRVSPTGLPERFAGTILTQNDAAPWSAWHTRSNARQSRNRDEDRHGAASGGSFPRRAEIDLWAPSSQAGHLRLPHSRNDKGWAASAFPSSSSPIARGRRCCSSPATMATTMRTRSRC
jgi:hypothetical protein